MSHGLPGPAADAVTVVGEGVVEAPADRAVVVLVAHHQDADPSVALARTGEVARGVVAVADGTGVRPSSRATVGTSLDPVRDQQDWQRVVGYEARQTLRLVVELDRVGALLQRVVEDGGAGMTIQQVQLEVAEPAPLADEARGRAFRDAERRARQLAALAGRELGRAISVEELADSAPGPQPKVMRASFEGASPSFEAGSQQVTCRVAVTFALG